MTPAAQLPVPLRRHSSIGARQLPPELRDSRRRQRILTAATALFAERGLRSVSTEDLAAAAEVSVGTLYGLFADKKECLLAAHRSALAAAREAIATAIPAAAPWPVRAEAALAAALDFCATQPAPARLLLTVIQAAGPEGAAAHQAALQEAAGALRGARAFSTAAATLPPHHEQLAIAAAAWRLSAALEGTEPPALERLAPELHQLLLAPYLGGGAEGADSPLGALAS
jgi:AcrR family transcriptional regulator